MMFVQISASHTHIHCWLTVLVVAIMYSKFLIMCITELQLFYSCTYNHSYTLMFEFNLLIFWEVDIR